MDPTLVMGLISSGLGLVDKFVDVVNKLRTNESRPFRLEAKQEADELVLRRDGQEVARVAAGQLDLGRADLVRLEALKTRVDSLWTQFNRLYAMTPELAIDERVRIEQRMEGMRRELCRDFRELVMLSGMITGLPLADHYSLHSPCDQ